MKRACSAFLTVALLGSLTLSAFAAEDQTVRAHFNDETRILYEGVTVGLLDSEGYERRALFYQDTEYVPLATVGLWMGADTHWSESDGTITVTSNGKEPVYYSTDTLRYEMSVTGLAEEEALNGKDGMDVQLLPSAAVIVNGEVRTFSDPRGNPLYPIRFSDCIYLPLRQMARLMGKQVQEFYWRYNAFPDECYLNIYGAPTQEKLTESNAYLSNVREHLNSIRKLCENGQVHTEGEFTDNVRRIQSELKAILSLPLPSLQPGNWYINGLCEDVTRTLATVDFYLPEEESSGARTEVFGTDKRIRSDEPPGSPEERWSGFVNEMLQGGGNTGRLEPSENTCTLCEMYLAGIASNQPAFATSIARSATPTSFPDAADIKYWTAVATLTELEVINGKDDGSFDPAGNVTRAEAAKMLFLIGHCGEDAEYDLANSKLDNYSRFSADCSDALGHWAEKYIQWCWTGGIINGRGDGSCDPSGDVTALELAKMILLQLGYDPIENKLTGGPWAENTDRQARELGLYGGLSEEMIPRLSPDGVWQSAALSRETAAQMLYNALQAPILGMSGTWGDVEKDVGEFTSKDWDGAPLTLIQAAFKLRGVDSLILPVRSAAEEADSPVALFHGPVVVDGAEAALPLDGTEWCYPLYCDGSVYVPLEAVGQWLGADTAYDRKSGAVTITSRGAKPILRTPREYISAHRQKLDLSDSARLLEDAVLLVDGLRQDFFDAWKEPICPLQAQGQIFLPLEAVATLSGKELLKNAPLGAIDAIYLYDPPTDRQWEEAHAYLTAIQNRLSAIRAVVKGEAPRSEAELTAKVKQVQTDLEAILDLPQPSFRAMAYFTKYLREQTLLVLGKYVTPYLPQEERSQAPGLQDLTPIAYIPYLKDENPLKRKWESFADSMLLNAEGKPDHTTYFMQLEDLCFDSRAFLSRVTYPPADPAAFSDAAGIRHWEAVAALSKLGVVRGKADGAFHPEETVTRAEAAKLAAILLNGGKNLPLEKRTVPSFSDTGQHWAEPYIDYCAELKILSGRGDGQFDPDAPVTALELLKMAESTLGYDADAYALNGPKWADNTDQLARTTSPSLYEGLVGVDLSGPLTRDDAAQILYNALRATPKRVAPTSTGNGGMVWQFTDAVRKDGSPASLLWERFGLEEVGALPSQPGKG